MVAYLEPCTSFWCWLKGIRVSTVGIVANRARIRGAIALTARLDPNKCISQRIASAGGGSDSETSSLDITPVTPSILLGGLDAVAT